MGPLAANNILGYSYPLRCPLWILRALACEAGCRKLAGRDQTKLTMSWLQEEEVMS